MSTFDDPNREAVGLEPIWSSAGAEVPPPGGETFDPSTHTVADVQAYIAEHPDEADAVLAAEAAGKNRATLTGGDT
jgi:hypothetical protein